MVLPPESNLTLISVFLPSVIHADNLPVPVSVTKINWHPTHIHPSHIVLKKEKKEKERKQTKTDTPLVTAQKNSSFPILKSSMCQ